MLKRADPDPFHDDDRPIGEMIGRVLDDGRAYAQAELDLLKIKAHAEVNRYRPAAIAAGAAAAFGLATIVAFSFVLSVGFSYVFGPLGGAIAAFIVLAVSTILLGLLARRRVENPDVDSSSVDADDDDIVLIDDDDDR